MAEVDYNSRVTTPRYGEPVTAGMMAKIKHLILNCVKAGNGIQVNRVGQSVVISLQPAPKGGGVGAGGDYVRAYIALTKESLPDISTGISRASMGFVTGAPYADMVCVPNLTSEEWESINYFE